MAIQENTMDVHKCNEKFQTQPDAVSDMSELAGKYGVAVGEAYYQSAVHPPVFKVYISIRDNVVSADRRYTLLDLMNVTFNVGLCYFGNGTHVFEAEPTEASDLERIHSLAKNIFARFEV